MLPAITLINYRNNKDTPTTAITAPNISLKFIFSLKNIIDGAIISTGTIPIIVDAIPVAVSRIDTSESETPKRSKKLQQKLFSLHQNPSLRF